MLILSNAYPTNLPNSEQVSQGGPANFTKLFVNYILKNHTNHRWLGVMMNGTKSSQVRLDGVFSTVQREYFRLNVHKDLFKKVLQAKSTNTDPSVVLGAPINRIIKLIKKEKPDVVFLNGFGILNWILLKAAQATGTPVVIQHAGIWTKELRLHKDRYSPAGLKIMIKMEKDSTNFVDNEIFLNTWSRDYYRKHVAKGSPAKTSIVPLPFDFEGFEHMRHTESLSEFNFDKKMINVGIIARWDRIKNHKAVLKMAKFAKKNNLPIKFHSIVTIPDREEFKKDETEYLKYVNVLPAQDRVGISSFCDAADILMLPSLFDVSPTVVLEAVATNTPIIISQNIGYVHSFESCGGKDWIIDANKPEESVNQILRLKNKSLPIKLKNHITSAHDHNKVFSTYINIFEKVSKR